MAKLRLTSVVFCTKFIFAKKSVGNVKHCTNLRGFQKGDRNPTSVVAGEGSQGEGESKHPLPVRVFGDFLHVEKVTPRSDRQCDTAKNRVSNAAIPIRGAPPHLPFKNAKPASAQNRSRSCCFHFTGFISSIFSIVNTVRKRE